MNDEKNISSVSIISRRFIVSGKVQGVFFRASTKKVADRFGLKGYAKNLQSGQVEVLAHGDADSIEELRVWLSDGPEFSDVDSVVEVDSGINKILDKFRIL